MYGGEQFSFFNKLNRIKVETSDLIFRSYKKFGKSLVDCIQNTSGLLGEQDYDDIIDSRKKVKMMRKEDFGFHLEIPIYSEKPITVEAYNYFVNFDQLSG